MPDIMIDGHDYGKVEVEKVVSKDFINFTFSIAEQIIERDHALQTTVFVYTKDKHVIQFAVDEKENNPFATAALMSFIEEEFSDCNAFCCITDSVVIRVNNDEEPDLDIDTLSREEILSRGSTSIVAVLQARDGRFWMKQRSYTMERISGKDVLIMGDVMEGSYKDIGEELAASGLDPWRESGPAPVR